MAKLHLIRHGQASFGASNYDCLSELGSQQGAWLGEHFADMGFTFDQIVCGAMQRHKQTAQAFIEAYQAHPNTKSTLGAIGTNRIAIEHIDARWNEFDFESVVRAFLLQHPDKTPAQKDAKHYFPILREALIAWSEDHINAELPETWEGFQGRVAQALDDFAAMADSQATILVFSSGGAIASAVAQTLAAPVSSLVELNLQIKNTAVTELFVKGQRRFLSGFNASPHLDNPERRDSLTFA